MRRELYSGHWEEVQIWAVRSDLPLGRGVKTWLGWAFGQAIRWFTRAWGGRYSHLALRRGESLWEATAAGVRSGLATEYCREHLVVDVYAAPMSSRQADRVVEEATGLVGSAYDWVQLTRIALWTLADSGVGRWFFNAPAPGGGGERLICSEYVALAHRLAGVELCGSTPVWRWTPDHVWLAWRAGRVERRGRLAWRENPWQGLPGPDDKRLPTEGARS